MPEDTLTHEEFSRRGGLARAAKLSPERRREIAKNAAAARERIKAERIAQGLPAHVGDTSFLDELARAQARHRARDGEGDG